MRLCCCRQHTIALAGKGGGIVWSHAGEQGQWEDDVLLYSQSERWFQRGGRGGEPRVNFHCPPPLWAAAYMMEFTLDPLSFTQCVDIM